MAKMSMYLPHRGRQTFAATRPSSVLLEQISVCVTKGEPVLLVGETGTGKTSTVQFLAEITGNTPEVHRASRCYTVHHC